MIVRVFLIALTALLARVPASAAQDTERSAVISHVIDDVIVGGYNALAEAAGKQERAVSALCAAPAPALLDAARAAFNDTVRAWSRIELFRFGPARTDNRFERIFYWPDRKGIGLRQVQALLAGKDEAVTSLEALQQKSVAVQGLPALEFVLFGTGSGELLEKGNYRCQFADAVADAIRGTAGELLAGRRDKSGHAALLRNPGTDNPLYKSEAEVLQALIQAALEQLQIIGEIKIAPAIGDAPEDARPKRAPFWRSGDTITALRSNIAGVLALFDGHLNVLLGEDPASISSGLSFELAQADSTLAGLEQSGLSWEKIASDPETHGKLDYALIPLHGAKEVVAERYPEALGLVLGFNSLDGD